MVPSDGLVNESIAIFIVPGLTDCELTTCFIVISPVVVLYSHATIGLSVPSSPRQDRFDALANFI